MVKLLELTMPRGRRASSRGQTCFTDNKVELAMGGFDQEIAWCKERRAKAIGDLREFCTGARQFRNKVDITPVLEARASEDIKKFDTIIAALEKYNGEAR